MAAGRHRSPALWAPRGTAARARTRLSGGGPATLRRISGAGQGGSRRPRLRARSRASESRALSSSPAICARPGPQRSTRFWADPKPSVSPSADRGGSGHGDRENAALGARRLSMNCRHSSPSPGAVHRDHPYESRRSRRCGPLAHDGTVPDTGSLHWTSRPRRSAAPTISWNVPQGCSHHPPAERGATRRPSHRGEPRSRPPRTGASNGPTKASTSAQASEALQLWPATIFWHYRLRVLLDAGGVTWPRRRCPPRIQTRLPPLERVETPESPGQPARPASVTTLNAEKTTHDSDFEDLTG